MENLFLKKLSKVEYEKSLHDKKVDDETRNNRTMTLENEFLEEELKTTTGINVHQLSMSLPVLIIFLKPLTLPPFGFRNSLEFLKIYLSLQKFSDKFFDYAFVSFDATPDEIFSTFNISPPSNVHFIIDRYCRTFDKFMIPYMYDPTALMEFRLSSDYHDIQGYRSSGIFKMINGEVSTFEYPNSSMVSNRTSSNADLASSSSSSSSLSSTMVSPRSSRPVDRGKHSLKSSKIEINQETNMDSLKVILHLLEVQKDNRQLKMNLSNVPSSQLSSPVKSLSEIDRESSIQLQEIMLQGLFIPNNQISRLKSPLSSPFGSKTSVIDTTENRGFSLFSFVKDAIARMQKVDSSKLESFDTSIILSTLKDDAKRKLFRQFAETEYSAENILFWEAVNINFANLSNLKDRIKKANQIIEEFLDDDAKKAVNTSKRLTDALRLKMQKQITRGELSTHIFDDICNDLLTGVMNDTFSRFKRSSLYDPEIMSRIGNSKSFSLKKLVNK